MIPPEFLIIPFQLIRDPKIHPLDERIYGIIYWLTRLKGEKCIASNSTLADIACCTPRGVQNSLLRLEKHGYIQRVIKDDGSKHRDEIRPLVSFQWSQRDNEQNDVGYEQPCVGVRTAVRGGLRTADDQNKSKYKKSSKGYPSGIPSESAKERPDQDIIDVIDAFKDAGLWVVPNYGNRTERKHAKYLADRFGVETTKAMVIGYAEELKNDRFLPKGNKPSLFVENLAVIAARIKAPKKGGITII